MTYKTKTILWSSANNFYNISPEKLVTLHKSYLFSQFEKYELNHLYHLAESITNYLLKIH